jgi:hypothetical protein
MLGYHYTTYDNWRRIQQHGLRPYSLTNLIAHRPEASKGIWLWKRKPLAKNHLGNIMRCVACHNDTRVVLLEVSFSSEDVMRYGRTLMPSLFDADLNHDGSIDNFHYHHNFPAIVLKHTVPPEQVKLLGDYDMVTLVTRS